MIRKKKVLNRRFTGTLVVVCCRLSVCGNGLLRTPGRSSGMAYAGTYRLPDTGQNKCYDNSVEIPCPSPGEPFHRQDGSYEGHQPALVVNGDGTVIDSNTGLMWQQK